MGLAGIMRKAVLIMGAVFLLLCLFAGYQLWQNHKSVGYPDKVRLKESLNLGIAWLEEHRDEVLASNNPMLWWMVKESAELNHNAALERLFLEYKTRYLDTNPMSPWAHLFFTGARVPLYAAELQELPDYNVFFLYGLSCSGDLAQVDMIKQQLAADFCDAHHPISPACATHQLMGARFMQRRHCDIALANELVGVLQERIVTQLTWDVRVVDVYLQRVLMLVDSGAGSRVKPIWLSRILDAQGKDGGWSSFQALVPVWSELAVGFSGAGIGLEKEEQANFHATAQGVLLMSLLLSQYK